MAGARLALVVANEDYADDGLRRLAAPGWDADALAEILGERSVGGFDVQVLRNESAQQIRFAIEDFFADRSPTDLLLVHFSCHSVKNASGELFLAAADTRPPRLASTAVAADFVNRQMADSRAQRIALFLDCCYGGAFPRGMVVRAAPAAQVRDAFAEQQDLGGGRGRVVVTASSAMQYAFEGDELAPDADVGTSVFTKTLVDGLTTGDADRDGDGWVGLTELFTYVSEQVRQTIPQQTPQMWTFGAQGDMHIARSRFRRITPAALPPAVAEAIASPLSMVRYGAADELRDRLHGEDVRQALAAWHALSAMVEDDSRKVAESAEAALAAAALRVSPEALELVAVGDHAEGELLLDGSPIALCATATSDEPWLHVEQDGSGVRVKAYLGDIQRLEGRLVLTGPITERLEVPVVVRAAGSSGKTESAPEPTPAPPPDTRQVGGHRCGIDRRSGHRSPRAARCRAEAGLVRRSQPRPARPFAPARRPDPARPGRDHRDHRGTRCVGRRHSGRSRRGDHHLPDHAAPAVRPLGDACDRRGCSRVRGSRTTEARGLLEREREHQRAAGICRLCDPLRCADAGCGPGVPVQPRGDSRRA